MVAQKKSQIARERDEEARGLWRWLASRFDARRLVLVDESGFTISMTRLRARAPKGKRAYGKVPRNRGKNTTLIAATTLEGAMGASMTVEGATDAEAVEAYVEHFLAPSLYTGQVVVLDGLGAHRPKRIRELIEARGADLLVLALLLARSEPHRGSLQQGQRPCAQGGCTRARGAGGGDRTGLGGCHDRRCGRLVCPRWLLASGSTLMSAAVRSTAQPRPSTGRASYVEYLGCVADVHKTLIIPAGRFMAPPGVGPLGRGDGAIRTSCGVLGSSARIMF
jgi:hypothetical protein